MDDSTHVPNRENTSLHLDRNNETVVSNMTECSWETPSVASHSSSAEDAQYTSTSLPPSKFRGSTGRRFGLGGGFGSGGSVASYRSFGGGSSSSRGSRRLGRSQLSGASAPFFDPIAEEGEGDEASSAGGSAFGRGGGGGSVGARSSGAGNMRFLHREHSIRSFGSRFYTGADERSVASGFSATDGRVSPSSVERERSVSSRPTVVPFGSGPDTVIDTVASAKERSVSSRPTVIPFGSGPDTVVSATLTEEKSVSSRPNIVPFGNGPDTVISAASAEERSVSSRPDVVPFGSGPDTVISTASESVSGLPNVVPFGSGPDTVMFAATGSVADGRRRRGSFSSVISGRQGSVGSHRDRPAAPFHHDDNENNEIVAEWGHQSVASQPFDVGGPDAEAAITREERAEIVLQAFDNTRYAMHQPKVEATREVNVALFQDLIEDADEIASLPKEYVLDSFGNRFHPIKDPEDSVEKDLPSNRPEFELFTIDNADEPYGSPFSKKRKWYSIVTICAAVTLALSGICISVYTLSSSPDRYESTEGRHKNAGHVYIPGHHFGGGVGGLVGGQETERRTQLAYGRYGANLGYLSSTPEVAGATGYAPVAAGPGRGRNRASYQSGSGGQLSRAIPVDPYNGFGPPQYRPGQGAERAIPSFTAAPLTSYTPPPNNDAVTIVLDPQFNGAFMDLSMLPYNPVLEMPVMLDVPFSGGSATKAAFGHCLRLVQCSAEGAEILARERELEAEGDRSGVNRRQMMLVPAGEEDGRLGETEEEENNVPVNVHPMFIADARKDQTNNREQQENLVGLERDTDTFHLPLRTEVVYTSTYVNVDCSSPQGIDRGIAKNLITSNMVDVIHSPDMRDVARLFAPPMQAYGRAVVVVRHPIARMVAMYNWQREFNTDVKKMTLEEFARSDIAEDNVLTRAIAGRKDLAIAKEILKRKFLVGLFDRMDASIERLQIFLHWNNIGDNARVCQHGKVTQMMAQNHNHNVELPPESSPAWISLMEKNGLDMALYDYAKFLYDYQGHALFGIPASSV